jgi:hypothetical protein
MTGVELVNFRNTPVSQQCVHTRAMLAGILDQGGTSVSPEMSELSSPAKTLPEAGLEPTSKKHRESGTDSRWWRTRCVTWD